MNRVKLFLWVIVLCSSSFAQQNNKKPLNFDYAGGHSVYVSLGGGCNIVSNVPFTNGKLELGYRSGPQSFLSIEFGGGSRTEKETARFTEYGWRPYGGNVHHSQGKINSDYRNFLCLISWSYIVDLSDNFQFRVGPSIGMLYVSAEFSYNPDGKKWESSRESMSEIAAAFGANTGVTWNFSLNKRWFLDLGWRLYGNTNISFDRMRMNDEVEFANISNQLSLSLGWRFGKAQ